MNTGSIDQSEMTGSEENTPSVSNPADAGPDTEGSKAMAAGLASGVALLPDSQGAEKQISIEKYRLGEAEYAIPIPMVEFQRYMYEQVMILHSSDILRFCDYCGNSTAFRESMRSEMLVVLIRTLMASTHPYLLVPTLQPKNLSDKDESRYIAHAGEKLRIIDSLVGTFKDNGLKLGIVARNGPTMDLVVNYLSGKRVKYIKNEGEIDQGDESDSSSSSLDEDRFAKITVILVPSSAVNTKNERPLKFDIPRADLVVALDFSFVASEPQVRALRGQDGLNGGGKPLAPVVRFVPVNSSEHAMLATAAMDGGREEHLSAAVMCAVMTTFTLMRSDAGKLPDQLAKEIQGFPAKVPEWIKTNPQGPPPVTRLLPFDDISDRETQNVNSVESSRELEQALSGLDGSRVVSELLNSLESDVNKPLPLKMIPAIRHVLKRIREADEQQVREHRENEMPIPGESPVKLQAVDDEIEDVKVKLEAFPDLAEMTTAEKMQEANKLQQELNTAMSERSRLEGLVESYGTNYSRLTKEREEQSSILEASAKKTRELKRQISSNEQRIEVSEQESEKLKTKLADIRTRLKEGEELIMAGEKPGMELQQVRNKKADIEAEVKRWRDRLKSRDTDIQYAQAELIKAQKSQEASKTELLAVKTETERLQQAARVEFDKWKALEWHEVTEMKEEKIKSLRDEIAGLIESIEVLKERQNSSRGRYGVRSSSVPRSGLSAATRSSRGTSPATAIPTSHPSSR
ncbi:class II histone deacetylase complex subunits 2 and 3-domain-containing protein [Lipomyces oligophaga]|uniref:class II histone deacetylase complex subunits 2 and 3-domain-containing protein n=1 Tax=Lipomyces oligophaga TaxID=45792 RepID=UPI0034CEEA75